MKCIEIALQAPTGSNAQGWRSWSSPMPPRSKVIGDLYRQGFELYANNPDLRPTYAETDPRAKQMPRVVDSATLPRRSTCTRRPSW